MYKTREDCASIKFLGLDEEMGEYSDSSYDEEMASDSDSSELYGSYNEVSGFEQFDRWGERDTCGIGTSESETFKLLDGSCKPSSGEDGSEVTNSGERCPKINEEIEGYIMPAGSSDHQHPFETFLRPGNIST